MSVLPEHACNTVLAPWGPTSAFKARLHACQHTRTGSHELQRTDSQKQLSSFFLRREKGRLGASRIPRREGTRRYQPTNQQTADHLACRLMS
jgi:hypothetical protein